MAEGEEHRQLFDLIERMLEYDPQHRITAAESLRHPFFDKLTPDEKGIKMRARYVMLYIQ